MDNHMKAMADIVLGQQVAIETIVAYLAKRGAINPGQLAGIIKRNLDKARERGDPAEHLFSLGRIEKLLGEMDGKDIN